MAGAFGAETAIEAGPIGLAIGAGVLVASELWKHNAPSASDFSKAQNEWQTNKVGGVYDMAALTLNTLFGWLPGHPALPVLGTDTTKNTQAAGMAASYSPWSPGSKGTKKTKHTVKVKVSK